VKCTGSIRGIDTEVNGVKTREKDTAFSCYQTVGVIGVTGKRAGYDALFLRRNSPQRHGYGIELLEDGSFYEGGHGNDERRGKGMSYFWSYWT
jgi:hypothetical protein